MEAWTFEAIGTQWQIDSGSELEPRVRADISARVEDFDRTWSRFRADSMVSEIATRAGSWHLPDSGLLALYDELHEVTGGAVNPLIGRALSDLGYDAHYGLTASPHPAGVPPWSSVHHSRTSITTDEAVLIDVGAAGKGCLVDHVGSIVAGHADEFTVDAGGDILHGGTTPMRVALEHPADPTRAIGVVELEPGTALCGSAVNRRAWGDGLHHVLDGRTGRPTTDVIATWVLATPSCMLADGLATAHFFAAPELLLERWDHQYVRMHADGSVRWSPDLSGEVFV